MPCEARESGNYASSCINVHIIIIIIITYYQAPARLYIVDAELRPCRQI